MKRLFQVRSTKDGKILPEMYQTKPLAKAHRDALGGPPLFVVTPGPDHRNYEGGNTRDRTRKA